LSGRRILAGWGSDGFGAVLGPQLTPGSLRFTVRRMAGHPAPRPDERPKSVRRLWIRPLLFAIAAATLPFNWVEVQGAGCGAPSAPPELKTGAQLLLSDVTGAAVLIALVLASLVLLAAAARMTRGWRILVQLVASVANAMALFIAWFAATFVLFAHVKLRPAMFVAAAALAATLVESLWRMSLDLYSALKERHER
jgi:hypothetical protein